MKVAVAGGFGFLGANVVRRLNGGRHEVVPFSRRSGVDIRNFGAAYDFLDKQRPDVLINCAAHVGGISYNYLKPVEIYEDNLLIGFNIVRAAFEAGVKKFVNIMPNCTYPGIADVYVEEKWWDGAMHPSVLTYGMPRKALWVHSYTYRLRHGFNCIHLVLPNLYGPGDHFDPVRSHALGALVKKIVDAKLGNERKVVIWGTGEPVREWGYVEDAAEGIALAMERYDEPEILNLGEGRGYTIREIAGMISRAASWDGEFEFDLSRPDGAPKKILDVSRMEAVLGWRPGTRIDAGIEKTVRWYLDKYYPRDLAAGGL
ncbi:MAG: NAD-dependent epimerase/dehydratase family protein [Nitrospiraceae bacterium]|nr:NAD-dependent epimerase/dehydratase family protein [Nitrospiraceae bacterium]